ncbi:probable 28S ribosomal protein S26, mitochondrial [Mizuhopecten yessoensis]|uniref:probable 28S ribosomal protein S26, mitochondrial n=1 Tax=Mizuhopecten yessoensis TaxID=6573 RepID=UPI000B45E98E|nr:probable 28S ribosomal protein S26, mitochondrial [Mizuhopecten yessoensis]
MSLISKISITTSLHETVSRLTYFPTLTFVRWRKPRHLPKARSKIYNVRQPTPKDDEETKLMTTLTDRYNVKIRAIRSHLSTVLLESNRLREEQIIKTEQQEREREWNRMIIQNEKWNFEVAKKRVIRQAKDAEARLVEINRIKSVRERRASRLHKEALDRVAYEMDQVDKFITVSNVDEEIERVLDSSKNYLFAVDKKGTVIGAESKQTVTDSDLSSTPETPKT